MKISFSTSTVFQRRLKPSEEKDYADTLMRAKSIAAHGKGKNILIVPVTSLPQSKQNNTGVGNLSDKESTVFFDFAKKYWGITDIQLLPTGQYHRNYDGEYPIYSSTSLELGNHMIDAKAFLPKEEFENLVSQNSDLKRVNFSNILPIHSDFEKSLQRLHKNIPSDLKYEFEAYKLKNVERMERAGIYNALLKYYNTSDTNSWNPIDKDLYDDRLISSLQKEKRIKELYSLHGDEIDFYYFKQFLADKSLAKAKRRLNSKGLKLNSDMICGFSYSERWANPKAFIANAENMWGAPVLDFDSPDGIELLKQKVRFNAERFDGFRVDAAWSYVNPKYKDLKSGKIIRKNYGDRILRIIDEEIKRVKGDNFDFKNIIHEFAADISDFDLYSDGRLKPFVEERVKEYTSDYMHENWGSADNFIRRGWNEEKFVIGVMNHDSKEMNVSETQKSELSRILRIPKEKLSDIKEFIRAKFAEPMRARNNTIFFMPALGIEGQLSNLSNHADNYTVKIPENYEEYYIKSLEEGRGFNPMDALEKQFKAQGLDKTERKLFEKIQKYRKIIEQKEKTKTTPYLKIAAGIVLVNLALVCAYKYFIHKRSEQIK